MSSAPEYLTTKEVAELLRLKERKVYDLAAEEAIPCTRATGKLLFSRAAIDHWLLQHSSSPEPTVATSLITGSHDPLLEWAVRESQCGIATSFDGSVDGLQKFASKKATVSALHLYFPEQKGWNVPQVEGQFTSTESVLVSWVYRQRGLVFNPQLKLKDFTDVKNLSIAGRQEGSGSQILMESLLSEVAIDNAELNYTIVARSEFDAVLAVAEGDADCTLGLKSLATQHQLGFFPMIEEPLELLIDRRFWFEESMQKFVLFCQSNTFLDRVEKLDGYRLDKVFSVRFIG